MAQNGAVLQYGLNNVKRMDVVIKGSDKSGVYFVRNNNNGNVKIGCSNNINNRFKALITSAKHVGDMSVDFELIDFIECEKDVNYLKLEKIFINSCIVKE